MFRRQVGSIKAVDGVSFDLMPGETLGLVGESGCGKSTVARTLLRLVQPDRRDRPCTRAPTSSLDKGDLRELRRHIQIIFQDPYASLNPRMTVGDIVAEPWAIHSGLLPKNQVRDRVRQLLELVGSTPIRINRYPHQFSGGQRQRIGVARALAFNPSIIICDEPVSALDVSVQAQVVNLLEDIQDEFNLSYIFIAHDLSMVRHISDRVAVMYLGKIVEEGWSRIPATRRTPTPRPCSRPCRCPIPNSTPASESSSKAMCRRRPIRHQGVISAPAAGKPRTSAPRSSHPRAAFRHPGRLPFRRTEVFADSGTR